MALTQKIRRILAKSFPPPDKIDLRERNGIIGVITSKQFQGMDSIDRQDLIEDVLRKNKLSLEELRRILVIVAVTPEEERAHSAD